MNAGLRVVNAATRRFVASVACETRRCGIRVYERWRNIDETIIAKTTEALQEGPIDWPNFSISSYAKVVRSRARMAEKLKLVTALMVGAEKWATVAFRRVAHGKPDFFVLRQDREIEIAKLRSRVVPVIPCDWIRRNAESRRREYPIGVGKVVQISEVLESPIAPVEPIPLRLLDIDPHRTIRVCTPTTRSHQKSIKETAFTVLGTHQKAAVEQPEASVVVQIAAVLVVIAYDPETAGTHLNAGDNRVIARVLSLFVCRLLRRTRGLLWSGRGRWLLCLRYAE